MVKVNEDLQRERSRCVFNVEELTNYLDGGAEKTSQRRELQTQVLSVKGILDEVPEEYLSHKEKYENAVRKAVLMAAARKRLAVGLKEYSALDRNVVSSAVLKDQSPFMLHYGMFIPAIMGQADDKQQEYWLKRATNLEIIGTYAQTELGHGTFIRGLETIATYDPKTEEFVLSSPTLTSYKWWPGGLAHTANYCVVMAQLYTQGKCWGIQPFIVQLRDEETHVPLKGIKLGEIGAKMGFNTVNNGFLGFDNYRIPRDWMLMKNAQVLKDGTFKPSVNSKLAYGTMVMVRVSIVSDMSKYLAKAATIAIRYSVIRRQSKLNQNDPESQILDYVTQQHKLFIGLASAHAYYLISKWLWGLYFAVTEEMAQGKLDGLPELHGLSCCLKAVTTSDAGRLVETARQACGGHGYMLASNLPQLYSVTTATLTYEGEYTVLMLQTARSLLKAWEQASQGKPLAGSMAYIADTKPLERWDGSLDGIIKGFRKVAAGKVSQAVSSMTAYLQAGSSPEVAWNNSSIQLVAATEAHCRTVLLSSYKSEVERTTASLSPALRETLRDLASLYIVYWALEKTGDLLLYTPISKVDIEALQSRYEQLLAKIRPNAVGLVDGFDFIDEILQSALGAYDGNVYERLMNEALKSPLNKEPVNESFHKYLKPLMKGKL